MKKCVILFVLISIIIFSFGCTNQEADNINVEENTTDIELDSFNNFQTNVDMSKYDQGIILAEVDGEWKEFTIRELSDEFLDWNFKRRIEDLEMWNRGEMPPLAGPHSGMVATYGFRRDDTEFKINNAVKGIGFLPKEDKIEEIIALFEENWEAPFPEKLNILHEIYSTRTDIFDRTKQISLELYTSSDFRTQTFLNLIHNPTSSIVFLDIPSYEIKTIAQLIHPDEEDLSDYEKNIVIYINKVHDFIHGESPRPSIAIVFHVIEQFDQSPRARGIRVVP